MAKLKPVKYSTECDCCYWCQSRGANTTFTMVQPVKVHNGDCLKAITEWYSQFAGTANDESGS